MTLPFAELMGGSGFGQSYVVLSWYHVPLPPTDPVLQTTDVAVTLNDTSDE